MPEISKIEELPDRIYNNYNDATFFITGGTGFLGKVIIERLLRMFDVKRIYVLIRTKKDKSTDVRLTEVFANPLFDSVRQLKGDQIFDKCTVVSGDITKDNLDISKEDREILKKEIEYVIHGAATVRFDEVLKRALLINTKGVFSMIQLAKEMENLKLFCHISTSFCHPDQKVLREEFYRSKYHVEKLISLPDLLEDDAIDALSKSLMEGVP
ncbi:dehydrogenase, partial [Oryctes borbonicus]